MMGSFAEWFDGWFTGWVAYAVGSLGFVLALLVGLWLSHRMLAAAHRDGTGSAGGSDAFGGFIEAFEPGRARAAQDLQSVKHQGAVQPGAGTDPERAGTPGTADVAGEPTTGKDEHRSTVEPAPARGVNAGIVESPGQAPRITIRRPPRPPA